jgi:hypothetical protein
MNVWEEVTYYAYRVGEKVEIVQAFKPKYRAFVGRFAVIRKIYAKKIGPDKHKDYTFFLEVQGNDAAETARFRDIMKNCNCRSFTEFLYGDDRCLLPCRATHMRTYIAARYKTPAPHMPTVPVAPQAGSKRPHDSSSGDASSTRDDSSSGGSNGPDNEDPDIKIGENVEILNTLYVFKRFIGYQGVVRKMIPRKDQSTPPSYFIEVQRTTTGETVAPELADEIIKLNKNFYTNEEFHVPWVCCRYVVLAEPGLPDPWTPETWARLPLHDRKAHRQKQHKDKDDTVKKEEGGAASSKPGLLQTDIRVGDYVEVLQGLMPYIGYYGVVREIRQRDLDTLVCFVELQCNPAGQTVTQDELNDITKMNRMLSVLKANSSPLLSSLCCNTFNVVLVDQPKPPEPWTPENWARLPFGDRKEHRQKHQQEREEAASKDKRAKTRRRLDMDAHPTHRIFQDYPQVSLGDNVQVLFAHPPDGGHQENRQDQFIGFQGVLRKLEATSCYVEAYVELQRNRAGLPIQKHEVKYIKDWNTTMHPCPVKEHDVSWFRIPCNYIVVADPTLPDSFVPQTWPPLLVKDRKMPPSEHTGIRIGDKVQITRTLPGYSDFVDFQGVVTSMIGLGCSTDKQNLYTTCFVELKYDKTGQPVTSDQIKTIRDWNKNLYSKHQWSWMKCKMEHVALVDEKPPLQASAAPSKDEPVRHIKYDLAAKPPWSGGEVKPYLYGRKVVFILEGRRGEPITR